MSEYDTSTNYSPESDSSDTQNGPQEIDIVGLLQEFLHALGRTWWVVVVLTVGLAAISYFRMDKGGGYTASYTAEATVSVTSSTSKSQDTASAEQLGKVFPYILSSNILQDIVKEDLGVGSIPTPSVTNVEGTNLLTITVTSGDPNLSYNVLQSVIKNYPQVAQFVVGQTDLNMVDDGGIPKDTGRASVVRRSARRGALIGFAISMMIVIGYMLTFRTIRTPEDLRAVLNVNYLGTLPFYKKKKRNKSEEKGLCLLDEDLQGSYVDAMRLVRIRTEREMEKKGAQVLMVTSSIPGEGKSTIAVNLAISMARKGKNVYLVDCDLRNPSAEKVFDIKGEFPGLQSVLNENVSIQDATYSFEGNDEMGGIPLKAIFGASKITNNVNGLGSEKMGEVIAELRTLADVVILDTPPTAMLVDAVMMGEYVDGALYVIMCDFARRQYILSGIEELQETGIPVIGCVINGGEASTIRAGHYSNYGSHYSHYSTGRSNS